MAPVTYDQTIEDAARSIQISRGEGRYLVATYWLSLDQCGRIRTGDIGGYLDVTPASATEMAMKLADKDLLAYEKHRGVELTTDGKRIVDDLAWRTCVVRGFFAEILDCDLDESTAYRIGYALSEAGIRRLRELLGHPCDTTCSGEAQSYGNCLFERRANG